MKTWPRLRIAAAALATLVIYAGCVTIDPVDPLMGAASAGDAVKLERLLDAGGNVDLADPSGTTLLMEAAAGEVILAMVVDARGNLSSSQKHGDTEYLAAVELLLERGADPNLRDKDGWTALHRAANFGRTATVRVLLAGGADPNLHTKSGRTALMKAVFFGRTATVRVLLTGGAEVDARDLNGWTALGFACSWGHESIVDLLLEAGADAGAGNDVITPLMTAAANGHLVIMETLLDRGVAVNESSPKHGDTALSNAAWGGQPEAVALLLDRGAPVNSRDMKGQTPLRIAIERGNIASARLLRTAGGVE